MEHHSWFPRFRELVLAGFTVTAIRDKLSLEKVDLSEFDDASLVRCMVDCLNVEAS